MAGWNDLSMKEKADVMKAAIRNGIYRLDDIRDKYDELMGNIDSDSSVEYSSGGKIYIAPSKKGTFTAAAKKHGKSVQAFASQVLAHPENYSPAMRKKANFARNASKWHADGGPLVDAANAHIYDGTTKDSQQMNDDYIYTGKPSQYDFQVAAEAPTVYWDGFNWIGFNDLGQRVTKGSNFNPSGARVIENPQEFENARLAQAKRTDINGTHRFAEKVRGVATLAAMAPMAGPLVEATTAVAPAAMPWAKGAMELGVRPTSTIVRGLSSYVPQASKAVPYFTGLDKTAMGMAGLFGMKDAYEGYKSGDKHWANALAEGALSGMMATELAPAVKYANELAGRGFNFKTPATPQITAENAASEIPNIVRTVQDNGKIRLSLLSHTDNKPRQFVLEPAPEGNNKYYVHMRVWDNPKNKVPGNITGAEKQQLFEALYNELPEGAEILFPKSGPDNYGTRGTVAGLQRLARDSRFTPGTKGTLQYLDKDGKTVRTYEGTSFIKTPKITEENVASITPEQWTAVQDAAIRIPLGERDNFNINNIRYLKGTDIQGNEYELPVRTMRGGIEGSDGQLLSDEELVNNWKRSQDFYKMRLRNAGLNKDGRTYIKNKEEAVKIAQSYDPDMSANEILEGIDDSGGAFAIARDDSGYGIVTKELNTMGKQRKGTTNSAYVHEDAHLMRGPEDGDIEDIDWSALNLKKDEAAARGTQIKSMLGIKDNTPVTAKQLEYMKDNFVRLTGMDNAMQAFLNSITDMESAARWISKNSYSKGGALNLLGYDFLKHPKGWKGL